MGFSQQAQQVMMTMVREKQIKFAASVGVVSAGCRPTQISWSFLRNF
jgi:hypothetical protein